MPRRLGQHFLARTSILQRIAEAAIPSLGGNVLEIGPGRGALTQYLIPRADRVTAVEIDPVLVHYLQEKFRGEDKLTIVAGDFLGFDASGLGPVTVVGNLPYYITSPIVTRVLEMGPERLKRAVFLVQREVAERVSAGPGSRDYGYLSVLCQTLSAPEYLFTVPPGAFRPPPKVDSAVVRLTPRPEPLVGNTPGFLEFAARCFAQKRKTLRNNLSPFYGSRIDEQPEAGKRAEQLSVTEMADLYRRLAG